jgi:hypothetical protein
MAPQGCNGANSRRTPHSESGADTPLRITLAVEVHFDERLRNQAVGQEQIVFGFEPRSISLLVRKTG